MEAIAFLAHPAFVVPWYAFGAAAAMWALHDEYRVNTMLPPAIKWAFPIIVLFFSVIGLVLYLWAARPKDIGAHRKTPV